MSSTIWAILAVFGMGVAYFIAAVPAGVAMGLPPAVAAASAWAGYTAIGAVMLMIGAPARLWLRRKFNLSAHPDPKKLFWRVWMRWGLPGLALLAPVTVGPYFAVLIAIALGERPLRTIIFVAVGCVPWCVLFATMAALGWKAAGH